MYGICHLSVVPVRAEAADQSEMISQLLFGEHFTILETTKKWIKIENAWDNYQGWISAKQFVSIDKTFFDTLNNTPQKLAGDLVQLVNNKSSRENIAIVLGSVLPMWQNNSLSLGQLNYSFDGNLQETYSNQNKRNALIEAAFMYLNSPYLWGGKSPFGIDCSGFTQMAFKLCHIKLPRDAWQQAQHGEALSFVEEALPGDLAFFDNEEGKIIHVGIVLRNNKIIHASGMVRIDSFDHQGIYHEESKVYSHNLRIIKNVLGA